MEKRLLQVLKAIAEYNDISLGDLLEGIVLHALEGKCAFSKKSQRLIPRGVVLLGLDLDATASHRMEERS